MTILGLELVQDKKSGYTLDCFVVDEDGKRLGHLPIGREIKFNADLVGWWKLKVRSEFVSVVHTTKDSYGNMVLR